MSRVQLAVSAIGGVAGASAYHTSILVNGEELSFGSTGVLRARGVASHRAKGKKPIVTDMGTSSETVGRMLQVLGPHFQPRTYDMLLKNCNAFTDACLYFMVDQRLPSEYCSLEQFGAAIPALVQAISGGKYTPNPRTAGFQLEELLREISQVRGSSPALPAVSRPSCTTGDVTQDERLALQMLAEEEFSDPGDHHAVALADEDLARALQEEEEAIAMSETRRRGTTQARNSPLLSGGYRAQRSTGLGNTIPDEAQVQRPQRGPSSQKPSQTPRQRSQTRRQDQHQQEQQHQAPVSLASTISNVVCGMMSPSACAQSCTPVEAT